MSLIYRLHVFGSIFACLLTYPAHAQISPSYDLTCLGQALHNSQPSTTVAELKKSCQQAVGLSKTGLDKTGNAVESTKTHSSSTAGGGVDQDDSHTRSLILTRIQRERAAANNRSSLTAHKRNYILPVSYMTTPNDLPVLDIASENGDEEDAGLDKLEAKFQVSLKTKLFDNIFSNNDILLFAFTATSFWQVYNKDVSSPFRETNYEPEVFWLSPLKWRPWNVDATLLTLGFTHQSNGQDGALSRSWNRVYANFIWEKGDFVFSFKPWYRIPESEKQNASDPSGDDNPDIEAFMGHFEFTTGYRRGSHEITTLFRNNLRSDNKGAVQIEWTFPLLRNVRGYAQYFNGYGESLIDYDASIERFGIGFLLTDLL